MAPGDPTPSAGRRSVLRSLAVAGAGVAAGCLGASPPADPLRGTTQADISGTIEIAGSSTVYPLTLRVARAFADEHPAVSVVVTATGTGGGFADFFCVGETDVNDASRQITAAERERCRANDVEYVRFRVATDALTVIVDSDADWIDCVTPAELATIWRRGGAERWSAVRSEWPDVPIERYGPSADSGTFDYFAGEILESADAHRRDYDGTEQDSVIVERVGASTAAIGYLGFAYYRQNSETVTALGIDAGDGCVRPSLSTAGSGRYAPLSRPLYVYVATESLSDPAVRAFLQYYLDKVDTALVRDVGYVPLDEATAARNRSRLAAAIDAQS